MKIGIVGTGNMGRVLGGRWALAGHEVFFGARRLEAAQEARALALAGGAGHVDAGSNDQAAAFGECLLYCLRGVDPGAVFGNISLLRGKILIDLNNSVIPPGFQFETAALSLAETLRDQAPGTFVVKAFNTLAQEALEVEKSELESRGVSTFLASDHEKARTVVESLALDLGLTPVNAGPLRNARLLESAGDLIRYLIGGTGLGPLATLNVALLSPAKATRFGGRRTSSLDRNGAAQVVRENNQVEVASASVIEAPIVALWALVKDFNNVSRWHPDVADSRLESGTGPGPGAIRQVRLRNGMSIREQLFEISDSEHFYTYSVIESPLPIRDHQSSVRFTEVSESRTQVVWSAKFTVVGADPKQFADGVKAGVLDLGIEGLRRTVASGTAG
jgi:8-hydroxy-5-deazaflavin:NADPH oxidoreductase